MMGTHVQLKHVNSSFSTTSVKFLYHGVLYTRINSKLRKILIQFHQYEKRSIVEDNTVFRLTVKGIKHSFYHEVEFKAGDLCFQLREEHQEFPSRDSNLCNCFHRIYYPVENFSCLTVLFAIDAKNGRKNCVKIQFYQKESQYIDRESSETELSKFQASLQRYLDAGSVQHWQVKVVSCKDCTENEQVYIGVSRNVFLVVDRSFQIRLYAAWSGTFDVKYNVTTKLLEIRISTQASIDNEPGDSKNFFLSSTLKFFTLNGEMIKQCLLEMGKNVDSTHLPPAPHLKHMTHHTSGSSSNGHIPGLTLGNMKTEAMVHFFNDSMESMQSNGSSMIGPHMSGSAVLFPYPARANSLFFETDMSLPQQLSINGTASGYIHPTVPRPHHGQSPGLSWPGGFSKKTSTEFTGDSFFGDNFLEDGLVNSGFVDDENLAPPLPCPRRPNDPIFEGPSSVQGVKHNLISFLQTYYVDARLPRSHLLRAYSRDDVSFNSHFMDHTYINVARSTNQASNPFEDVYYRFYYNLGMVQVNITTMRKKIRRRSHLAEVLKDVDFSAFDKHEEWFDKDYKNKESDTSFMKIHKMNIPARNSKSGGTFSRIKDGYSRIFEHLKSPEEDDPYYTSDLCLCLQRILEMKKPNLAHIFDLTRRQMNEIHIFLSLVGSDSDWKVLAEKLYLRIVDIGIIEHFCYSYRELASFVLLTHWALLSERQPQFKPACNRENFIQMIQEMDRKDVLRIMRDSSIANEVEDDYEIEITYL
ncbi:hypothetical protein CHS0354_027349 [Potamilus streckersoni]|uniref:Death domain-containing protein n=1 Tax=Potamilus streckersoni TaxID=2493646 RepID=A0AAE0SLP2_9BIVA|nr:hypothetical protein CHS0354_027349 [Potamilus streckersoni]